MKKEHIRQFLEINVGLVLCALGIALFFWPTSFVTGGSSGLAILLELIFDKISNTVYLYIINIGLLFVSLIFLGRKYFVKTIYASIMLPTMVMGLEAIITHFDLVDSLASVESWIVVAFGGILLGTGVGLNLRNGGSTGGFDVIQSILFKFVRIPYSISNFAINAIVIIAGIYFNGLSSGLAAFVFLFVSGYIIDSITFGGFNRRAVLITSDKAEEIRDLIIHDLQRGCTYFTTTGGYTKEPGKTILCVCLAREYLELRNYITLIDPDSFIVVMRATEVRGMGFTKRKINK